MTTEGRQSLPTGQRQRHRAQRYRHLSLALTASEVVLSSLLFFTAPGKLQSPDATLLGSAQGVTAPVVNGVQLTSHQNGVSANGEAADFEEMMQLKNSNSGQQQSGLASEPILAFEGGEPFLMKTGPMKPQHVAGTVTEFTYSLLP